MKVEQWISSECVSRTHFRNEAGLNANQAQSAAVETFFFAFVQFVAS